MIKMNLMSDLLEHVLSKFKHSDADILRNRFLEHVILTFLNYDSRKIEQKCREVFLSEEISQRSNFESEIQNIANIFKSGRDLSPYLSDKVEKQSVPKELGNPVKRDPLLNHWGIHHLHLGPQGSKDYDKDELLYVKIYDDKVFFIDILGHSDFANVLLLEIIDKNWPEITEQWIVKGVKGERLPDQKIQNLRNKRCNVMLEVNGKTLAPTNGEMSSGHTLDARIFTDEIIDKIKKLEETLKQNEGVIKESIKQKIGTPVENVFLKLIVNNLFEHKWDIVAHFNDVSVVLDLEIN